jgi:PDZ domain-containing protein
VSSAGSLRAAIGKRAPGRPVRISFTRAGKPAVVTLTTVASGEKPPRALIGVMLNEATSYSIKVDIKLKDVGGPSAGLMFALGIIEKLGPESLTGGRIIAGSGEITTDGAIGRIGGIPQKMLGARKQGATVFLVAADNCQEAKANKPAGLLLVKVSSLKTALSALRTLRDGGTPPSC